MHHSSWKKKQTKRKQTFALHLLDIAGLVVAGGALINNEVITNAKQGNIEGAVFNVTQNVKKNWGTIALGIGMGVAGKMIRKKRLSPSVGMTGLARVSL